MFEKEAEDYSEKDLGGKYLSSVVAKDKLHAYKLGQYDGFVKGAEFGYNKVNEWHDLRKNPDDLPKNCKGKLYLVNIYSDSQLKFEYAEYTPTVCLWNSEWKRFEIIELTVGSRIVNIRNVIAWKEIVLPKESE